MWQLQRTRLLFYLFVFDGGERVVLLYFAKNKSSSETKKKGDFIWKVLNNGTWLSRKAK